MNDDDNDDNADEDNNNDKEENNEEKRKKKRLVDYRIKIYKMVIRTIRTLKLFLTKKVIRRIKKFSKVVKNL